jgi:hypothetical protein
MTYSIQRLPLNIELESKPILKKLMKGHQALAELKGVSGVIPNQSILISTYPYKRQKIVQLLKTS